MTAGIDADADGILDTAEVTSTQYVCDGAGGTAGAPGAAALVNLTPENAGANCAWGGTRIDSGLDADGDGLLDPNEVTSTQYVCTPDVADPYVVEVEPAPGAIASGAVFVATFSEAMDPATIDGTSVFLVRQEEYDVGILIDVEVVPATVTYDAAAQAARLVPAVALEIGYPYALHVTARARDLAGNVAPELVATYWVETDGSAPRVGSVSPLDGGVAGPNTTVSLTFDEPLNWDSGNLARIALVDGLGVAVAGSSWWDGWNVVYFAPDAPLTGGEAYTASIDAVAADWDGNWRRITMAWSFTVDEATLPSMTGPPVVVPASQVPGGDVEITIPVNVAARYADVWVGDDVTGWSVQVGFLDGNWNGEGSLTGTFQAPWPPASGSYSIWARVHDGSAESWYVANATVSGTHYSTWDSSDPAPRASAIPLVFLQLDAGEANLSATVDLVPGTGGAADVVYTIRNTGTAAAGPFVAGIFVNPDRLPVRYQIPDRWLEYDGLAAGAEVSGTFTASGLPETVATAFVYVDLTSSIDESSEDDNLVSDGHRWAAGTSYSSTTPMALADDGSASQSPLVVSSAPTSISSASVALDVTHPRVADLNVFLVSPSGTYVNLVAYRGGAGADFTSTVFDDWTAIPIASGSAPFTGTFRPEGPIASLLGEDGNGTWRLEVYDSTGGEAGTLDSWTLTLW